MHLVFTCFTFGSYWGHIGVINYNWGHIGVILGSHWVHIWVTFGARIARQACATNWVSKEEVKIDEFPDWQEVSKAFSEVRFPQR